MNVEITAYALLALVNNNQIADGLPIMKWLLSQQNENGGFQSTQDTVVGISALAAYAEKIAFGESNTVIGVSFKNNSETGINIHKGNSLLLQTVEVNLEIYIFKSRIAFTIAIPMSIHTDSIRCEID